MTDAVVNTGTRRKPLTALLLSFIEPGLGHIYCGRIIKGFILAFLASIFVPLISAALLAGPSHVRILIIGVSLFASLVIWLIAMIDSWYVARHTRPDYELKEYNRWYVYVIFVLMSTAGSIQMAMSVRSNLLEAFRVPATSMFPTIEFKDRFLANKSVYKNADPQRGDVIVFISPENRRQNLVRRVVAIAGDTVEIKDNQLYVNGEMLERKVMGRTSYYDSKGRVEGELFTEEDGQTEYKIFISDTNSDETRRLVNFPKTTVPAYHCFVLGDNRNLSNADSRHFGPVPLATVKGRADFLYYPVNDWSRFGSIK